MIATTQARSGSVAQQVAEKPKEVSCLRALAQKISEFFCSRWAIVLAVTAVAGACFGALVALATALVGSVIASVVSRRTEEAQDEEERVAWKPNPPKEAYMIAVSNFSNPSSAQLVKVFKQTREWSKDARYVDLDRHEEMISGAVVCANPGSVQNVPRAPKTDVGVYKETTFQTIQRLAKEGYTNPAVLDMANRFVPGGSVCKGAPAQEETLCRQSDLYSALYALKGQYPLPQYGVAYVPGCQFFRDDDYRYTRPLLGSVIVSAAYNLNPAHEPNAASMPDDTYKSGTCEKIRNQLRVAIQNGHKAIVLDAFGCEAYCNNPQFIAATYKKILEEPEFANAFERVAFGIFDPSYNIDPNYRTFQEVLGA